jgi:hypothetical protein
MNRTRLLSTLAAAVALTGSIGLAYAQTTYNNKATTPASTDSTSTQTPMQSTTPSSGSMSSTTPSSTDGTPTTTTTEPAPKVDRG